MARKRRLVLTGMPQHLVQRGHNREPCYFAEADHQCYLHDFHDAASRSAAKPLKKAVDKL